MLTMNKWQQSLNLVLLELHKKLPKNSMLISMVIRHLRQIVKVKNLLKWLPRELTENQKAIILVSSSLNLHDKNEQFLDWIVMCLEKWILCNNW